MRSARWATAIVRWSMRDGQAIASVPAASVAVIVDLIEYGSELDAPVEFEAPPHYSIWR